MTDNASSTDEKRRDGFWAKMRQKLSRSRDKGLRESLEGVIESHEQQNPGESFKEEAKSMMLNLIEFADTRVGDVMVPRADIVAVEESATMREVLERFIEANHSRMPLYRESLDDIAGMVHVKDFLRWMSVKGNKRTKSKTAKPALNIAAADLASTVKQSGLHREVLFVPPSMPAADLLVKMQASHIHLAIVVDEYGGTDGLISIEDLVEEIVGDISDEHDTDEGSLIRQQDENIYIADARVELARVEELLKIDLLPDEEEGEADTLAGLVYEIAGRVPSRGEIIRHPAGLDFEIVDSDPRRVKKVRITVNKPVEPEAPAGEEM
jgi:CBS domain containing-hemolysin-like protein